MVEVIVKSSFTEGARILYPEWTLEVLAQKLEQIVGIPPESQRLVVISPDGEELFAQGEFHKSSVTLKSLRIPEQSTLKVEDTRSPEHQLHLDEEGTDQLPKMTAAEYERRPGTVLEFKRQHKLGRFSDPQNSCTKIPQKVTTSVPNDSDLMVTLNDECFVRLSSGQTVRGVVAFVGTVSHIEPGTWVGVRLFTADGRNNGVVKGVKLFDAEPKHGVLVRPASVRPLNEDEEEL